jgi:hypothetical protein
VDHVVDLHLPVQVLPVHPVRIVMAHLQVAAPQVVVTHPIAALTQVDHQLHGAIHRVQVRAHLPIAGSVVTVHAIHVRHQIVPIVHPVLTVTDQSVVMIVVRRVIVQQVAHMETETHVQVQIVPIVHPVHTEIETHVHLHDQVLIGENVVTAHVIHDHLQIVPIVRHVLMVIDQNAVMIVVHRVIVRHVLMATAIHVRVLVRLRIAESAVTVQEIHDHLQIVPIVHPVLTVTVTHVRHRAHLPIVASAVTVRAIHAQVLVRHPIVHAEKIHTVAIAHAQAMIAMPVHLRVTANAVADQIGPEVVSPMIAKNAHAGALAKSV